MYYFTHAVLFTKLRLGKLILPEALPHCETEFRGMNITKLELPNESGGFIL